MKILALIILASLNVYLLCGPDCIAETAQPAYFKVFFLGLDGATWRILLPLVNNGSLPNLKRALDDGVYGNLISAAS